MRFTKARAAHGEAVVTSAHGFSARLVADVVAQNPREAYDNLWTLSLHMKGYTLAQEGAHSQDGGALYIPIGGAESQDGAHVWIQAGDDPVSQRIGVAYVTRETLLKEYASLPASPGSPPATRVTPTMRKLALSVLAAELAVYNAYLRGDTWGWILTNDTTDEVMDSCWGYYGTEDAAQAAREAHQDLVSQIERRGYMRSLAIPSE